MRRLGRGDWSPQRSHPVLLTIQLLTLWQAALRGLDYVGGVRSGLDAGAASPAYGWLLYGSTVVVLFGLALRRASPIVLGHALLASWYVGIGVESLADLDSLPGALGWTGIGAAALGVWALLAAGLSLPYRILGVLSMLGGQYLLVADLGADYRTGTGLVSSGFLQASLAVGTLVLWQRQRLRKVVEEE